MKLSLSWLREWVNPAISDEELMHKLTMAGLEIDGIEPVAGDFSQVVVGEIRSIEKHPGADKLRICQVAGHPDGEQQVVCGAANARVGLKIPFALVGASLPARDKEKDDEPFEIQQAELRGVESNGMLCGADELGIESLGGDGLMELPENAPVGEDLRQYLALHDSVIEISITPNRADCLSLRGIAREVGVLTSMPVDTPEIQPIESTHKDVFPVELKAGKSCPRYAGRLIKNIDITKPSPLWLQEKLRRSGIRTIDAVVDVTNFVLLELGQPMHAFDFDQLQGKVVVREAEANEKLKLLNDQEANLDKGTLLIADANGPLAMAGVMGGQGSAVSVVTKNIFLESAYFDPVSLSGVARSYGLHTDSSHRFERGVDYQLQELAIERATALLLGIVGGEPGPIILEQNEAHLPRQPEVKLRLSRVARYLGLDMAVGDIISLLEQLGMKVTDSSEDLLTVIPPSWRFDISEEVDLLEEIARIVGYNQLPSHSYPMDLVLKPSPEEDLQLNSHKTRLASLGYREVVTYSFVDPKLQDNLGLSAGQIPVANPISEEMGVMRTSLLPGLLNTALHNLNRQQERVRLFESGLVFSQDSGEGSISQVLSLGVLLYGLREPEVWSRNTSQPVDFYDIKGDVEALLSFCLQQGADEASGLEFMPLSDSVWNEVLHPGQSAVISLNGSELGYIGALHPAIQQELGFPAAVYFAQIELNSVLRGPVPAFEPLSRFPEVRRDLAFLVDKKVPVEAMLKAAKKASNSYLANLKVFDVYSGEGIDPQRKSVGLGLTFRAKSRTLRDSDINENVDRVVAALSEHFQADLRS